MSEGLLSLQWNNHKFTLHQMLSSIRKKKSYTDTTLACDGLLYPVHKIVLSMCSKYFEEIFAQTQGQHPVIILKDIKRHELECLLNYMYIGEVNVPQEKLAGLIKAAECLQIKGLAVPDEEPLPTSKSNKGGGGEKRGREESQTSEAKKRKQDVCNERNLRNSRSSSPVQTNASRAPQGKEQNENSSTHSSKSKISFRSQQKSSELFSSIGSSESTSNKLEDSSNEVLELSSLKEEAVEEEEEAEESYIESGPEAAAIKEEPVYLSDSNSNDGQHQHELLSAETVGHDGSQMHFMEQLLANEAASESLADDVNCVREGNSSDAQLCSTVPTSAQNSSSAAAEPLLPNTYLPSWSGDRDAQQCGSIHSRGSSLGSFPPADQHNFLSEKVSRVSSIVSGTLSSARASGIGATMLAPERLAVATESYREQVPRANLGQLTSGSGGTTIVPPYSSVNFSACSTSEGMFVCPVCSKSFIQKYKLKRHYLVHTGEKPFLCTICDFRCNQKNNLKLHIFSKHE